MRHYTFFSIIMETQNTNFETNSQQPVKPRKSRKGLYFFFFLLLIAAAGAGYYYYSQEEAADSELEAYTILEGNESLADYEDYLQKFPQGPHADEVRTRLEALERMYVRWRDLCISGTQRDFELFKKNYPKSLLVRRCDLKIDSLDWIDAQEEGTLEAITDYLVKHPEGLYASEASIAQDKIADATPTSAERVAIEQAISGFYSAFGNNDEAAVFTYITPTMTRFLSKTDATKADVADLIARTYNEHIHACQFVVNDDYVVHKEKTSEGDPVYKVSFSVDQHITRDNEGKTFGSYTAEATVNAQYKISSVTMKEISRR